MPPPRRCKLTACHSAIRTPRNSPRPLPDRPQRRRRPRQPRAPPATASSSRTRSGKKVAALSEYLGHQTNNFAEYQGLIAALEYAVKHGPKALKLISDSELLVRQIKGIYKVKNAVLQDLHGRAKELIAQLDWFSIGHALREHNQEADHLANEAMDKGMGEASVARTPCPRMRAAPPLTDSRGRIRPRAWPPSSQQVEGSLRRQE